MSTTTKSTRGVTDPGAPRLSENSTGVETSLAAAIQAVKGSPGSEDAWTHLEEIADRLQCYDEVASVYREILDATLPKDLRGTLAQQAVRFHEAWFGDDTEMMSGVLLKIVKLDPDDQWALERLTALYTVVEQWDPLLAVYDQLLEVAHEPKRRTKLLDDAAHIAKDFARLPERAVFYYQQLLALDRQNKNLAAQIERLLEQQGRWSDLIEHWHNQCAAAEAEEAQKLRRQIIACCLDQLDDQAKALDELVTFVEQFPGDLDACVQLERVLTHESVTDDVRGIALAHLLTNYDMANNPQKAVDAIEKALAFADREQQVPLHREAGLRLMRLDQGEQAMAHFGAVLLLTPTDLDARNQLRQIATRSNLSHLLAQALVAAAEVSPEGPEKVALLIESANLYRDKLQEVDTAIELYAQVLASPEAESAIALSAAHSLVELLSAAGRSEQQLEALERLARLERAEPVRRAVLGKTARLAEELGDINRALTAWGTRLDADGNDLEALSAVIELLEKNNRFAELVEALGKRAASAVLPAQRRADLVRIAEVFAAELEQPGRASETWMTIIEEFGFAADAIDNLDRLMAAEQQWPALAELLERATQTDQQRTTQLFCRIGEICKNQLDEPNRAVQYYTKALSIDAGCNPARHGLLPLLDVESYGKAPIEALINAARATDDWQSMLGLLEPRLVAAESDIARAGILTEAARIHEQRAEDPASALQAIVSAFPLDPTNRFLESELVRLAKLTHQWDHIANAYIQAAAAVTQAPKQAAHFQFSAGRILEYNLDEPERALQSYWQAHELDGRREDALVAVVRVASLFGQWSEAAKAGLRFIRSSGRLESQVVTLLESAASETDAWDALTEALEEAISGDERLPDELAGELELMIARWHREKREDHDAARTAAMRAVARRPKHLPALELLAQLQRQNPDEGLVETLLSLSQLIERDLDVLVEAAKVALETELAYEQKRQILGTLYYEGCRLWGGSEEVNGTHQPPTTVAWAIEELSQLDLNADQPEQAAQLLLDAARLPFNAEARREMLTRAAEILENLGRRKRAIRIYREVLEEYPDDLECVQQLAQIYEQENRVPELLMTRRKELELTEPMEERLQLRLMISQLVCQVEGNDDAVQSLRANLEDEPGHPDSLERIYEVLSGRKRFTEIVDLFENQAQQLQAGGELEAAAGMWTRVAGIAESELGDARRAKADYERSIALVPDAQVLDALARLNLAQDEPAEAAEWLTQRLELAEPQDRVPVLLKLARAQRKAGQQEASTETLETAFAEAPRSAEVRKLILTRYRDLEDWEALAKALVIAAEHIVDESALLSYAKEVADLYTTKLGTPQHAVSLLERVVPLAEDDRELRRVLVEGLLAAERFEAAREHALALLEAYGRRRSPERAMAHLLVARVARALGNVEEALDQLDQAYKMDSRNAVIGRMFAELAREAGQLDRAERVYRTLLLLVRNVRFDPGDPDQIGALQILLELSYIAAERDETDKVNELRESIFESLGRHDDQAPRLQAKLRERGEHDVLERVYKTRLAHIEEAPLRAAVQLEYADLLSNTLDRPAEAFDAMLQAIDASPAVASVHDATQQLADQLGQLERYIERLESLLSSERVTADPYAKCELLLRLSSLVEKEMVDSERAYDLYKQADATGVREVDVWRVGARLAAELGDDETQVRLLTQLARLGEEQVADETRADALYRLAEIQLATQESLTEGTESLQRALSENPRYKRVCRILGRTCATRQVDETLFNIYEQVARRTDDDHLLLEYFERYAEFAQAVPDKIREGVELAGLLGEQERVEEMLMRAVQRGQEMLDGLSQVAWALLRLADRRKELGDLAGAVKWLFEAVEVADPQEVLAIGSSIADLAIQDSGDYLLAAKLYERLYEFNPQSRDVWGPLADVYCALEDDYRLERLVEETLDSLPEPDDRNRLRLMQAKLLLNNDQRQDEAVELLKDVLLDDPNHSPAQLMLIDYYERTGNETDYIDLLRRQFETAMTQDDAEAIKQGALKLGKYLEENEPEAAAEVYKSALDKVPADQDLLERVLRNLDDDTDPRERAEIMEKVLIHEEGERGAALALEIVAIYETLEDEGATLRVLKTGNQIDPSHVVIRERLERIYRERGDHEELAVLLSQIAKRNSTMPKARIEMLVEAADIHSTRLADPETAVEMMREVVELDQSLENMLEFSRVLCAALKHSEAIEFLSSQLEQVEEDDVRLVLYKNRATIRQQNGDGEGYVQDLEAAFELDQEAVATELIAALNERKGQAAKAGDLELERAVTLRLAEVCSSQGNRQSVRELLEGWVAENRSDLEVMRQLSDLYLADEDWEQVAKIGARLVVLEEGDEQIEAVCRLADACERAGQDEVARDRLEAIYTEQPDNARIRQSLVRVYEKTGALKELGALLIEDAKAAEDDEQRVALLQRAGNLLMEAEETEMAISVFKEALDISPQNTTTTDRLVDIFIALDDVDNAAELVEAALKLQKNQRSPERGVLELAKAKIARHQGDAAAELAALKMAVLCDRGNGQLAATLADRSDELEDWEMAVWALRTITLLKTECPISHGEAFLRQAKISLQQGDKKRAMVLARQAKHKDPESSEVDEFLATL